MDYQENVVVSRFACTVYGWVIFGIMFAGICSYLPVINADIFRLLYGADGGSKWGVLVLSVAMIILAIVIPLTIDKLRFSSALILYLIFATITGGLVSAIHFVYDPAAMLKAFLITIVVFGAMAAYGSVTQTDLTRIGNICAFGLFGLILASLVNLFIGSPFIDYVISWAGIVVFIGITAYDAQQIRHYAHMGENYAIICALSLFLDFVNLFLRILRISGSSKRS